MAVQKPGNGSSGKGSTVKGASFTCRSRPAIKTPSAGTGSPARSSTTPGTISSTGTDTSARSRRTSARIATERRSVSTERSARCSCDTSSTVHSVMTETMMARLTHSPLNPAIPAATSRMATKGSAKRLTIFRKRLARGGSAIVFAPNLENLRDASTEERPETLLLTRAKRLSIPSCRNSVGSSFMRIG